MAQFRQLKSGYWQAVIRKKVFLINQSHFNLSVIVKFGQRILKHKCIVVLLMI